MDYRCGPVPILQDQILPQGELTYQCYDPDYPRYAGDPVPAEMVFVENASLADLPELYELTEAIIFLHAKGYYERWLTDMIEWFTVQTFQMIGPDEFFIIAHRSEMDLE